MTTKIHNLPIRLTASQFAAIEAKAADAEMAVSTWMRELALGVAGARQIDVDIERGRNEVLNEAKNTETKESGRPDSDSEFDDEPEI